jgi:hypothetical protein
VTYPDRDDFKLGPSVSETQEIPKINHLISELNNLIYQLVELKNKLEKTLT